MSARDESIVILGAGLAGGNAAATLREEGFRGRVVLVGAEPTPPFGRPPLSKEYLRGEKPLDDWFVRPATWYGDHEVELLTAVRARHVDTAQQKVTLDHGTTIAYDRLALCTGGRPRRPDIPGLDTPGVHLLRTVRDCDAIKQAATPGRHAVVVGMGFIGAEVAASLTRRGVRVTAVFSGAAPLQAVLGGEVAAVLADVHRDNDVLLIADDTAVAVEAGGTRVVTRNGRAIDCDFVVVGAGIAPDTSVVDDTPVSTDNGILVDAQCRTDVARVYAAGDVANHLHPLFGRVRVEHYNNAEKMGRAVARSMLGDEAPYDYVHTFWSDQYQHTIEYVGHATRWDRVVIRGSREERRFIAFYLDDDGVLGAAAGFNRGGDPELDADSEMRACQDLVAHRAEITPAQLGDERVDLRELAVAASSSPR